MKKISMALFIVLTIIFVGSCEKDDICVDGDTPLLVIAFYNIADTAVAKAVPKLRVGGIDNEFTVNTISDRTNLDSIGLPLKTNDVSTSYVLIKDSADDEDNNEIGNGDVLTFSYTIKKKFVSRACGFVANFENLSVGLEPDANEWIQDVIIADTIIENQAAAHVKIYH
ncbi:hypothetical protein GGR42_000006 [Saonia flava]|uniref:Uncharacterized protein n=1 Tax=Saonia flava TaxID=523696 RepID=A0A846QWQ9_9FLAO|nr:DUF6452 family protein [Saonia flava]NJB69544.1 hypothetical protein [Saonia flava]